MSLSQRVAAIAVLAVLSFGAVPADEENSAKQNLRGEQESISGRYARFERVLTQMADLLGYEDPERAELLRRAISESNEKGIALTLDQIAGDLGRSEFGNAINKQKTVTTDLRELLKLLQSEDRMSAVDRERQRIANLLNDVNNLKARQRAVRARTQNSTAPSSAAPGQQEARDEADGILDKMNEHDGTPDEDAATNENSGDSENGESPKGQSSEGDPSGQNGSKSDGQEGESTEGDSGKKDSDGDPKDGDPKDGDPAESPQDAQGDSSAQNSESNSESQGTPSQNSQPPSSGQDEESPEQTPGKQQMKTASNLMQEALDQLQEQDRDAALAKQDKAISELQNAANALETLLQQLREEEKEMVLATLEARFQRLLSLQTRIYDSTVDLAATPREEWLDTAISLCRELSQEQAEATQECSFTSSLLREDGTSVSILVAVEDIEADMGIIADRLQQTKVGPLTQSLETDVIEALKELIEATQREMAEMKEQENQPQSQQDPSTQKPPLVQFMEELKVLRSLQRRVNRRTRQVNGLFEEATTDDAADLNMQLDELARRQERLRQSALKLAEQMEQRQ